MTRKKTSDKKIRVTLDLSPQFFERLEKLEALADAGTKANLIRQALQTYEFLVSRALDGDTLCSVGRDGRKIEIALPGILPTSTIAS